jgi:archaeosine synthase
MTEYFEIHERDAPARRGELRLADSLPTPAIVDDELVDAGSQWTADHELPAGEEGVITVLPHRALPPGTPTEVADAVAAEIPDISAPSAAVVSPDTAADHPADATVLAGAPGYVGESTTFVDAITQVREATPPDTALYLPGVATPRNVAMLAYAGVDLVDTHRGAIAGSQGRYLTTAGEDAIAAIDALPCACGACQTGVAAFDREDCIEHNENALRSELARVRQRIRDGRLREHIEVQVRHADWLTATLRTFDEHFEYLEQHTPVRRGAELSVRTAASRNRVEIQRFADRVASRYRCRFDGHPLVLVPESSGRPFSESHKYGQFHGAVGFRGHIVTLSSLLGPVPQELELTYPAQQYSGALTGVWRDGAIAAVADRLEASLRRHDYPALIAHVPDDGHREVCQRVAERLDETFTYTVDGSPTSAASLSALSDALADYSTYAKRERQHNTLRAIADYQFRPAATADADAPGDDFFPAGALTAGGHHPQLRAHDSHGEQLATVTPEYGLLALTLAGGRRWQASSLPVNRVEIDDFVPHGSVLAPGVVDASAAIRVGDEVVIEGPDAFAVGRARMSGPEMADSTRGIACQVRHCEEL